MASAYRAEHDIAETVRAVTAYLRAQDWIGELVVVVPKPGPDDSWKVLEGLLENCPELRVITVDRDSGKGWAIQRGMAEARGAFVCFIDADNAVSFEQIEGALGLIDRKDIVIGSRYMPGGDQGERSFLREVMSRGGNFLMWLLLGLRYTDTRAPMKLYKGPVAAQLFPKLRIEGFGFDTELLFLAKKYGYTVVEYPVKWDPGEQSTVEVRRDALRSIWELVQIRWNWLRGRYRG